MDLQVNIRARLTALRERHQMTQEQLAKALGFENRQTLSSIENGERRISPEEMVAAARVFEVGVDYFTDPFELAGEGHFSWRRRNAAIEDINRFERAAGRWIAAYRYLSKLRGTPVNSSLRRVALNHRSSFEAAWAEGEAIAAAFKLGDPPAQHLADVVESQLDTLVLYVDAFDGISGAACQLEQLNAVVINRSEVAGRRNFDLAHELFHLLTWEQMPPQHVEGTAPNEAVGQRERRIEQLADNFAGALLMPTATIRSLLKADPMPDGDPQRSVWLAASAQKLRVSGDALKWRLACMNILSQPEARRILPADDFFGRAEAPAAPSRFSKRFVDVIGWGIEEGHLSARRAATLLQMTLDEVAALFSEHGLRAPFAL